MLAAQVRIESARSSIKVRGLELEMRLLSLGAAIHIHSRLLHVSGADPVPSLRLLLHIVGRLYFSETATQVPICDNIEAAIDLFGDSRVRNFR